MEGISSKMMEEAPLALSGQQVAGLLAKHGFSTSKLEYCRWQGVVNSTWLTDKVAVRISLKEEYNQGLLTESIVVPAAIEAGVRTPSLLILDTDRDLVPTFASIYERFPGVPMAQIDLNEDDIRTLAHDLAEQLFLLHSRATVIKGPPEWLQPTWQVDFPNSLTLAKASGRLSPAQLRWASDWADRLETDHQETGTTKFLHHDIHASNLLVSPNEPGRLTGILDWSDAGWGNIAGEFPMLPAWMVPRFVEAYQEVAALQDDGLEARTLRLLLWIVLDHVPRRQSAAAWFGDWAWNCLMRLVDGEQSPRWRRWMPKAQAGAMPAGVE